MALNPSGGGPALYLTESQAAEYNARRFGTQEARPYLYFQVVGGRTICVANAADKTMRIPADELKDMAQEAGQKVARQQQPRTEATDAALRNYWGDLLQWTADHQRGRQVFGPHTFSNRRWRNR